MSDQLRATDERDTYIRGREKIILVQFSFVEPGDPRIASAMELDTPDHGRAIDVARYTAAKLRDMNKQFFGTAPEVGHLPQGRRVRVLKIWRACRDANYYKPGRTMLIKERLSEHIARCPVCSLPENQP